MKSENSSTAGFVVTRQPVFDRRLNPWATAVGFSQSPGEEELWADEATAGILLESYMPQRRARERTLVRFSAQALLARAPLLLWPEELLVEVDEADGRVPGVTGIVTELRRAGYGVAVTGWRGAADCADLTRLADVLGLDLDGAGSAGSAGADDLPRRVAAARASGADGVRILVDGLRDWAGMMRAHAARADLLRGFFFQHMTTLRPGVRNVTATQLSRIRLLGCLGRPDADFNELAHLVEADAGLAYRLLVFVNSASFGLGRKVGSIRQAIVLAGWHPLQRWLEMLLITDLSPSARHQELCYYAAQRADFLKRVARAANRPRLGPALSLLGLFSYLEGILEMPASQALERVSLDDALRLALCGHKSPFSPWLALVRAMERADWGEAERLARGVGLELPELARCYRESFVEADTLFRALSAPEPAEA